ncbi:MAG: flippase-like domain-containing protein [Rhodospirillaceae bacterium]
MRWLKLIFLLLGLALLWVVVADSDLAVAADYARQVGWGFALVLALYFAAFLVDTFTWQLTLPALPISPKWIVRFFNLRMAGEAFNNITPAASMGGEPVKAVLLKKYYGVSYQDGVASLILARTINVVALIAFLAIGFVLILQAPFLTQEYKLVSGVGLAAFATGIVLFFLVQRFRVTSHVGKLFGRDSVAGWITKTLTAISDVEDRLVHFYQQQKTRLLAALALAFANWVLGAAEVYYVMAFLGNPISWTDAWIIESIAQLVRAGTFFIPASIGAQEGAFILVGASITGSPAMGLAVAIVRRLREIIWIAWGLVIFYVMKPDIDPASGTGEGPSSR